MAERYHARADTPPLVILMGPTGAGKSALALTLARRFRGEIISADSRQIYAGMNVGTDKVGSRRMTNDELRQLRGESVVVQGIPHYLIDILTPDQQYSAAAFRDDARRIIAEIHRRSKLPIVVGGTGFYLRALTGESPLAEVPPDPAFRRWAATQKVETLRRELLLRSPDLFTLVDNPENRRRVTRYLEIARGRHAATGNQQPRAPEDAEPRLPITTRVLKMALMPPRNVLRQRIEARVEEQLRRGLVDEVRGLRARYGNDAPGLQAVGYRQVSAFLRGTLPASDLRTALVRAHWDYARRQRTWLRREPQVHAVATPAEAIPITETFLHGE